MEVDQTLIGTSMKPFSVEIEKGAIRAFATALGEHNRLYFDEEYAKQNGYPGLVAPPTFPTSFRPGSRQPWLENLDQSRILAGEQYFHYERSIVAGDVLECTLRFIRLDEKHGRTGKLQLIIQELRAVDESGELVVTNGRVVIYRAAPSRTEMLC